MSVKKEEIVEIIKGDVAVLESVEVSDFDTSLDDLGVDSLDLSSMFLDLEETFDIEFSDEEIDELSTINKIIDFINSKKEL